MAWCKLHGDILGDPKLMRAARKGARHLLLLPWLLAWAKEHDAEDRGRLLVSGQPAEPEDIAAQLPGATPRAVAGCFAELEALGVLVRDADGALRFARWEARSAKPSDRPESVRERVQRHRSRKRLASARLVDDDTPVTPDGNAGNALRNAIEEEGEEEEEGEGEELPTTTARAEALAEARADLLALLPADYVADLDDFLARTPPERHLSWLRSLQAKATGMHPPLAPPAVLGEAVRQFNTNGETNWKRFEGYVGDLLAGRTPAAKPAARTGQRPPPQRYDYANATQTEEDVKWTT